MTQDRDDGSFLEMDGDVPLARWYFDEDHGAWIKIAPEHSLVWDDDGYFIEFDEDGVPLGMWYWDEDEEMWIFDDQIPLGDFPFMPQTGRLSSYIPLGVALLGLLMVSAGMLTRILRRRAVFKGKTGR